MLSLLCTARRVEQVFAVATSASDIKIYNLHGHTRTDEHHWLADRQNPEVLRWLENENRQTEAELARHSATRRQVLGELRARLVPEEASAPEKDGAWHYFCRYVPQAEYPRYFRRPVVGGDEELLLDVNALADGHDYFALDAFVVSPDHRRAAYAVDTVGNRFYQLRVIDLMSGETLGTPIVDVTDDIAWGADSDTLIYVQQDSITLRHCRVLCRRVGEQVARCIFEECDETYWVGIEASLSERVIVITSEATLSTEVHLIDADCPDDPPRCVLGRESDHEYYVADGVDRLYVLSNKDAANFRVFECPADFRGATNWKEIVPHRPDVLVEDIEVFEHYLVLSVVEAGLDHIEIYERGTGALRRISFDQQVYSAGLTGNCEYRSDVLRYSVESLAWPETIYEEPFGGAGRDGRTQVWQEQVGGDFAVDRYTTVRKRIVGRDGTSIPVSLVFRRGLDVSSESPLLVEGYGAYGISSEAEFDSTLPSLLDRGWIYALAHVRGGSELGRGWYEQGRQRRKMNSFLDFIDVVRGLHRDRYSSPEHTYATGGSAGGLLIAAVANLAPGLFNGLCAHVPFTDVVSTMLDPTIPLTTGEYDEWGNPATREDYFYMLGYSPYDNVRAQPYPHLLVTAALHDSQVQYWDPAKWVARLRERRSNDNLLLLHTDLAAGHTGKTGRYQGMEDVALEYAFLLALESRSATVDRR